MNLTKIFRDLKLDSYVTLNSIRWFNRERRETRPLLSDPPPTLNRRKVGKPEEINLGVHRILYWTKILSHREKCLVWETYLLRTLKSGLTIGDYFILSALRSMVREDSKDFSHQRLIISTDFILDTSLSWEQRKDSICFLYRDSGSDPFRKLGNLIKRWSPEKFLTIKDIPVETLIERSHLGIPYSSYCKGYGEGSGGIGPESTPFSAELDGIEEKQTSLDLRTTRFLVTILNLLVRLSQIRG
jgi:hypothetical protein